MTRSSQHLFQSIFLTMAVVGLCLTSNTGSLFAQFNLGDFKQKADTVLKGGTIEKLQGNIKATDKIVEQQLTGFFGKNATEMLKNVSSEEAIITARNTALGVFSVNQLQGTVLNVTQSISSLQSGMNVGNFYSQFATNSAMNSKYFMDQGKNMKDQMQNMNKNLQEKAKKYYEGAVKLVDKWQSKLPNTAMK